MNHLAQEEFFDFIEKYICAIKTLCKDSVPYISEEYGYCQRQVTKNEKVC